MHTDGNRSRAIPPRKGRDGQRPIVNGLKPEPAKFLRNEGRRDSDTLHIAIIIRVDFIRPVGGIRTRPKRLDEAFCSPNYVSAGLGYRRYCVAHDGFILFVSLESLLGQIPRICGMLTIRLFE